jgi:cytochrome b6-f complex iron-sulfur subunit
LRYAAEKHACTGGTALALTAPGSLRRIAAAALSTGELVMDDRLPATELVPAELPSRRDFCTTACQALTLLTVGAVAQGCGGGGGGSPSGPSAAPPLRSIAGTATGSNVQVTIDAASPLATVGGVATVQAGGRGFLVSRTSAEAFTALTSTCTHEQCTITGYSAPVYQCPCHGSQFSTSGSVVRGPASAPLRQFQTTFAGDVLTIVG